MAEEVTKQPDQQLQDNQTPQDPQPSPQDAGVPQDRFNEIYRKWKEEQEKNQVLQGRYTAVQEENYNLRTSAVDTKPQPQPQTVPIQERKDLSKEEWNEWFQEDPGAATEWKAKQAYKKEREADMETRKSHDFLSAQSTSREKIVTKHSDMYMKNADGTVSRTPEGIPLFDVNSPKVAIFNEIVRNDPDLTKLRTGPEKAMREMERIMEERNIDPKELYNKGVQQGIEQAQKAQTNAQAGYTADSSGKPSTATPDTTQINLTDEERRTADKMGINYKDYQEQKGHVRRAPRGKVDYK